MQEYGNASLLRSAASFCTTDKFSSYDHFLQDTFVYHIVCHHCPATEK